MNDCLTNNPGADRATSLFSRLRAWNAKVGAGGFAFASGRYPMTTRIFATRPKDMPSLDEEDRDDD